ncbi:MAG TPA: zf-HC2 domain-containing protein [Candidatus Acidoferrales bacterium]|nr:zf-HC2 domain-containing protein [Candidatus Acidoferrales bacterium]
MSQFDDHFDEVTGLLFLERQLDESRAREVSAHLASCAACRELLHALESEGVWLRQALVAEDESIPAHLISAPERGGAHWGWIAAFGLGVGGAYTLWSGFIEPWIAQASQAGFTQGNVLTMLLFTGAFWKGWDAMRSLTEFLAVATLGTVAIWLLRRHWQRVTAIALVMGAIVCALALPPAAQAADVERGNPSYTLPAGQEVKTDLIVWAVRTRIDGDVDGDLIVWSQNVTVNGHVKGDILGWAQELRVNGTVDGNVRAWAQTLSLGGPVGKNVLALTGESYLDEKATVGGTMTMLAGTSELSGKVAGDLLVLSGDLSINGSLGRDATIRGGQLTIGPSAEIKGQTKYTGNRQPEISPGAKLGSPIDVTLRRPGPDYSHLAYYWHQVLFWGASFLFGLTLLLAAPAFFFDTSQASKRIGPALGFGALFMFAVPTVAIIVCFTIVGLGVGIATILLYAIAVYAAQVFVGAWLGEKLLGAGIGVGPAIGRLALGLGVLHVLLMLPYAGPLAGLIIRIWGLGALVLALHKQVRPQLAAA